MKAVRAPMDDKYLVGLLKPVGGQEEEYHTKNPAKLAESTDSVYIHEA